MMNDEKLVQHAIDAYNKAICPYSNYAVGAVVLTSNNKIISGFNIESKAYPTTLCAERVAIFSALSQGHNKFLSAYLKIHTTKIYLKSATMRGVI